MEQTHGIEEGNNENVKKGGLRSFWEMYCSAWLEGGRFLVVFGCLWIGNYFWNDAQGGPYDKFFQATKIPAAILIAPIFCYFVSRFLFPELKKGKIMKEFMEMGDRKY